MQLIFYWFPKTACVGINKTYSNYGDLVRSSIELETEKSVRFRTNPFFSQSKIYSNGDQLLSEKDYRHNEKIYNLHEKYQNSLFTITSKCHYFKRDHMHYRLRTTMKYRNIEYIAMVQLIQSHITEHNIRNDVKYIFLPEFEMVNWWDIPHLPYEEYRQREVRRSGINKPNKQYSEYRIAKWYTSNWYVSEEDWYYDPTGEYTNSVYYTYAVNHDNKSQSKSSKTRLCSLVRVGCRKDWKFGTKYRKQYEKNICDHIDTVNETK